MDWQTAGQCWSIALASLAVLPLFGWVRRQFDDRVAVAAAARGEALDGQIPLVRIPLADSQHLRVAEMKAHLDHREVTADFDTLRDELVFELQNALANMDILIAHNVCSLNKNLILTAALKKISEDKSGPRMILWHHDLAWTTPRYRNELHTGYPWDLLRTAWPGVDQVTISRERRRELASLMEIAEEDIWIIPNGVDVSRFLKLETLTTNLIGQLDLLNANRRRDLGARGGRRVVVARELAPAVAARAEEVRAIRRTRSSSPP